MRFLAALLFACVAHAQTVPASAPTLNNWCGAGAGYSSDGSPKTTGWISCGILANASQKIYSQWAYDIIPQKHGVPLASARTGAGTILRQVGNLYIVGLGTLGVAQTGSAVTSAFSGGGLAIYKFPNNWTVEAGARIVKAGSASPAVYEVGFGRAW